MSARVTAAVPTAHASRYLQQLCKHWSHKLEVRFDPDHGSVKLPGALLTLSAGNEMLDATLEGEDAATVERLKQVVADHLDRFAFREAPLPFDWHAL